MTDPTRRGTIVLGLALVSLGAAILLMGALGRRDEPEGQSTESTR